MPPVMDWIDRCPRRIDCAAASASHRKTTCSHRRMRRPNRSAGKTWLRGSRPPTLRALRPTLRRLGMERVRAGLNALTGPQTYDEALAEQAARSKRAGEEAGPILRGTGEVLGGMIPGIGLGSATSRALGTASRPRCSAWASAPPRAACSARRKAPARPTPASRRITWRTPAWAPRSALASGGGAGGGHTGRGAYRGLANRGMFGGPSSANRRGRPSRAAGLQRVATTPGAMLPDAGFHRCWGVARAR